MANPITTYRTRLNLAPVDWSAAEAYLATLDNGPAGAPPPSLANVSDTAGMAWAIARETMADEIGVRP